MEHVLVTFPDPRGGKKDKESDKIGYEVLPLGRVERVSGRREKRGNNSQGKDPRTFREKVVT